ncbi:hypothetical protein C6A86_003565 [Mycobacterium sp. ITM-2016-00316]|uniref:hypothetical protein n=1 Tax=Mycobacterium sp. ITM-2016-00316 TaxID=2099695 RepID=UPI000CF8F889|nr:hypothetical protein [Mycobacterium sp. ITM-2016-00316]WNG82792.1 hypothetical protein C6A86_003565 [Mycobacterium sp. ITM-2016-00316]
MTTEQGRGSEASPEEIGAYEDNRPTSVLPGSDGTVSGTAVTDWLDGDGNPKFDENSEETENPKN